MSVNIRYRASSSRATSSQRPGPRVSRAGTMQLRPATMLQAAAWHMCMKRRPPPCRPGMVQQTLARTLEVIGVRCTPRHVRSHQCLSQQFSGSGFLEAASGSAIWQVPTPTCQLSSCTHRHHRLLRCVAAGDGDADGSSSGGFLLPGVVGPVRERQPALNSAPRPPAGPVAGAAFPVATHRSKSKVQCHVHMFMSERPRLLPGMSLQFAVKVVIRSLTSHFWSNRPWMWGC